MKYQQSWPNIELNRIQMAVSSWTAQHSEKKRHKKAHIVIKQEVESKKKTTHTTYKIKQETNLLKGIKPQFSSAGNIVAVVGAGAVYVLDRPLIKSIREPRVKKKANSADFLKTERKWGFHRRCKVNQRMMHCFRDKMPNYDCSK